MYEAFKLVQIWIPPWAEEGLKFCDPLPGSGAPGDPTFQTYRWYDYHPVILLRRRLSPSCFEHLFSEGISGLRISSAELPLHLAQGADIPERLEIFPCTLLFGDLACWLKMGSLPWALFALVPPETSNCPYSLNSHSRHQIRAWSPVCGEFLHLRSLLDFTLLSLFLRKLRNTNLRNYEKIVRTHCMWNY